MEFTPLEVLETRYETDDYQTIVLKKPSTFSFILGECFSLRIAGDEDSRIFSFASSPTEEHILISYKKGISAFKKKLENIQVGDSVEVALYGSQFHFNEKKSSVFIAGGIGITAFRSIIKYCIDTQIQSPLHLIYLNKSNTFPFKKELEVFSKQLYALQITYISTLREGHLTLEKIHTLTIHKNDEVYLAGPPRMIDDTVSLLQEAGVMLDNIHTESFDGYFEDI